MIEQLREDGVWPLLNNARYMSTTVSWILDWIQLVKKGRIRCGDDVNAATTYYLGLARTLMATALGTVKQALEQAVSTEEKEACKQTMRQVQGRMVKIIAAEPIEPVLLKPPGARK